MTHLSDDALSILRELSEPLPGELAALEQEGSRPPEARRGRPEPLGVLTIDRWSQIYCVRVPGGVMHYGRAWSEDQPSGRLWADLYPDGLTPAWLAGNCADQAVVPLGEFDALSDAVAEAWWVLASLRLELGRGWEPAGEPAGADGGEDELGDGPF
jgi:hypothetical protein